MNIKPTVFIKTHGCKLNQADSLKLNNEFHANGYELTATENNADVVVLNTCTVTATADSKARQYINSTMRKHPNSLVVITGCYAQAQSEALSLKYDNCIVLGNDNKDKLVSEVTDKLAVGQLDIPSFLPPMNKTRAMVKIQEGCDQICAYCIVPRVRGRETSIEASIISSQINRYHEQGFQEVVLTGTQLGTYGFETPGETLEALLIEILEDTVIPRIRVSSLQAHEITPSLLSLWDNPRLQNHFHIPLQSGDDNVLSSMRRRYTTKQFQTSVKLVRDSIANVSITTDWIIGFPGETDQQFNNSVDFARSMKFSDIHPFTYSIRPGTSAAHMNNQVSPAVKKTRMDIALKLKMDSAASFKNSMLGKDFLVLWETLTKNGISEGHTSNYIRVVKPGASSLNSTTLETLISVNENGKVLCRV